MKRLIQALTIAACAVAFFSVAHSQTLNPSYLAEMPAPERVLAEIKGKDAEDTGERQMGAFMALVKMMDDMAWGLGHRYVNDADTRALTPDERRLRLAYQTAYAQLWHKVTNKEGHVYDHDRDLNNEMLAKLFSEEFRVLYFKSNANAAAGYKAFHEKMYENPTKAATTQPMENGGPGSQAELRRCIASGRSMRICFSEVMGNGFEQLGGMNMKPPVAHGPRMTGDYSSVDGLRLIFQPDEVTVICRGVPAPRPYTVQLTDRRALITIQNESKPVVFSLGPDGRLAGSGPITVIGQVPAGSHTEQTAGMNTHKTTTTRELTPLEAQNYPNATQNGQVYTTHEDTTQTVYGPNGSRTVTDFVSKTASCTIGLLNPAGPSPLPLLRNDMDILTAIGAGMGALMKGGNINNATKEMLSPGTLVSPGLRMSGRYAAESGFSLNFHPESVTVGCGDAERALEYSVQRTANKTALLIKDNANPISLQLMADGSVVGAGTVQVNGRVITGTTEDVNNPFVFAPHTANCAVGRLVAAGPADRTSTAATTAAPTSLAKADAGSPAVSAGATSLRIASGPGVTNLLAGKALIVLKESLEEVLKNAGVSAQEGNSRISTWARACERSPRDPICQQGVAGFSNYIVARAGFDRNGTAAFNNVPSLGAFYIVADTSYTHHLVWNVRVDLKPGVNSITLDEHNMTPLGR